MKCPECKKGDIRVLDDFLKDHQLICDRCITVFVVSCDPSFSGVALPPEFSLEIDDSASNHWQVVAEKKPILHDKIKEDLPLLEDFKAQLAKMQNAP